MIHGTARLLAAIATAALAGGVLTACVGGSTEPMPVPTPSTSGSSTAGPQTPTLHPDGSAAANHLFFDLVNQEYWDVYGKGPGQDIVTNLVNHGFIKSDMEVTFDTTALDLPADSLVVSVRIDGECLVGQFGPTEYTSILAPLLGTGRCLVGTTRPIDW